MDQFDFVRDVTSARRWEEFKARALRKEEIKIAKAKPAEAAQSPRDAFCQRVLIPSLLD
jgi:hypothetical protein